MPWVEPKFKRMVELRQTIVALTEAIIEEETRKLTNLRILQENLQRQKEREKVAVENNRS
jgi:hypothetical protein